MISMHNIEVKQVTFARYATALGNGYVYDNRGMEGFMHDSNNGKYHILRIKKHFLISKQSLPFFLIVSSCVKAGPLRKKDLF